MTTMIRGSYVIGWDQDDFVYYRDGQVVYDGDTITYVGTAYDGEVDEVIDAGDSIIAPGFVDMNALGDVDHHLIFAGFPPERATELQWSQEWAAQRVEQMSAEDEAAKSLYAYVSLIRNGVTTAMPITSTIPKYAGETYEEIAAAAEHAERLGLRVYLGPSYLQGKHVRDEKTGEMKVHLFDSDDAARGIADAERFIKEYDGRANGRIRACVVPERIELQTEEALIASKELAKRYGVPIRLHAAQGMFEYDFIMNATGMSPVAYLDSIGFLDELTLLPHGFAASGYSKIADQSDADLDILRDRGVPVIHCPLVIARMGSALETFGRYLRHGIRMCMGSDTWPPDMIYVCTLGSYLARILDDNKPEAQFDAFYRAATVGGADALGRPDLGRLAPGCRADIIAIDISDVDFGVRSDPLQSLMMNGSGSLVKTSIIDGNVVMRDRVIPGIDMNALLEQAQGIHDRMRSSYRVRAGSAWADKTDDEFFGSTYPYRE